MATSRAAFKRSVDERYSAFTRAIDETLKRFAGNNREQILRAVAAIVSAGSDLKDILSSADQPHWLGPITDSAGLFLRQKDQNAGASLLDTISQLRASVNRIEFDDREAPPYDFDALFEKCRDESRLPELFDQLIDAIKAIVDSGEIDSLTG